MSEKNEVYTLGEVASRLKISTETLRRRIAAGELSAVTLNAGERKHHRITSSQLQAWLGPDVCASLFPGRSE
ncbi:helix-turn-helix domain-containing protein [Deinococcus budaensis]|uniref:Excisionase family DNA binding protein n=1 Tax=Deinococcus budaensis TaxID=1665626 RepID=A0A7W8LR45_9DEIO|nr:helix-turn-helix domain-containing protein [Deinococcus budaensis]MBB5235518.1 excisionase family DNA binding protein [Deinococcus budaensis]